MNTHSTPPLEPLTALIYCRVSSTKQKLEGSGLASQEHRCRQYADGKGYAVEAVFPDDSSGGGDFMKRPGMRAMLAYLDAQKGTPYVVIFDDLKRFARDTEFHIKLRREFAQRGARIECLNFNLEDTPEGRFIETIIAAQGQLEREQNRRQVVQKMKARVEKGYYVFHPPVGYRYARNCEHGKLLVPDEPVASIVREVLQGFASGRFTSQSEVMRFLEAKPEFLKSRQTGEVRLTTVRELLARPTYAGYVEAPNWGISLRKGFHEPLIDLATHERIQARLRGSAVAPARKDINEDFPLRGFVLCDDCDQPMTSCWSKGRNKHYAYYLCDTPNCASHRRSIPRADIEDGAEAILRCMRPARQFFALARAMFTDIWNARQAEAQRARAALSDQIRDIEKQIEGLLDRIMEGASPTVAAAYEQRIEKLERRKLVLADQAVNAAPPEDRLEELIEPALTFLSNL
ncbi:resolvase [Paracoccus mutanolyticus]|uniref:Resolvase n=1 Tax=Paracoccus mutanolyticus TaxID=1499308 RepID=A0ABM6WQV3_9RHOB|nr:MULTISPECIES: recombinase family protein [Paracoccus]AWX92644.1 resolvase [Paracoccus mutanolyticus]AWX92972.1 resolvase [Paracoccus mutanolyticus]